MGRSAKLTGDHGKKLILLVIAVAVIIAGILIVPNLLEKEEEIGHQRVSDDFGTLAKKEYNGKTYVERVGLTPILFIGVDKGENAGEQWGYQRGGQADFLLLMVIDPTDKKVSMLQIDRDTITDVEVLGVLGGSVGMRKLQIALSHSYGKTQPDNCDYTIRTVSRFLQDQPLELYFSINMAAIPRLNDLIGGVTVTMEDDHTKINPLFTKGATVKLDGQQAFDYVHSRQYVDDGTNSSRMKRQSNYMNAARDQLLRLLTHDNSFVDRLFDSLGSDLVTNISRGRLINETAKASQFKVEPIYRLPGEHRIGNDRYMEFYPDEQALMDWVLSVFYRPYGT